MTSLIPLTHIFVVHPDGSGHLAAVGHTLADAEYICEALEVAYADTDGTVVIDPPAFGLIQNVIRWGAGGSSGRDVRAVPWREFIRERAQHETLRATFDALYIRSQAADAYETLDRWEMR